MKSFHKYTAILALVSLVLFGFQGTSWATALASTNVTVTTNPQDMERVGRVKMNISTVAFGDGALTYPTNGVPLPAKSKFGVDSVKFMHIMGPPATGYTYKYDATNHTIRIYQSAVATHTHDLKVIGGITADEDLGLLASGPTLGKLAATDRTIAGADSATKGGVVSTAIAAAPLVELGAVAIAATSLTVMTVGR